MSEIEWAEPPAAPTGGRPIGKHAEIAAALKERPGEWALILRNTPASMVTGINKATTLPAYAPAGSFQAVGRNHDRATARCDVYARFVGEDGAA